MAPDRCEQPLCGIDLRVVGEQLNQTTYDANSNRATVTDQLGRTTSYTYDRLNRLTNIGFSDGVTPGVTYTYDANGSRLTMVDGTGTTSYSYDELGRLLAVTSPATPSNKTVSYRYDRDGNRIKLIYPNNDAVTYAFDRAARLTTVTDWASRVTTYDYYADGALEHQTNVNGTVAAYAYDNARRLLDVWNQKPGTTPETITRHQFTMDAVGNRTQVAETLGPLSSGGTGSPPTALPATHLDPGSASTAPTGLPTGHLTPPSTEAAPTALPNRPGPSTGPTSQTLTYGYDSLYRLTSASGGPAGATSYTYDPVGNRATRTRNSVATTYAVACPEERRDRADRIDSATTPTSGIDYDVNPVGNVTMRGSDALVYDQANRLTSTTVGSTTATYTYDGDGKRISKTVGSTTTSYVYDSNRGLPVLLEDGTRRYVWGLGLAYEVESGAALVYHVDGLGSVRAITDNNKLVVQTYDSDEFGVPISTQGGLTQPFGFTGEQRDSENGLIYLRARYYDPQLGRFIQRDLRPGHLRRTPTLHRYAYANNSPVNLIDPSGYESTQQALVDPGCLPSLFGGACARPAPAPGVQTSDNSNDNEPFPFPPIPPFPPGDDEGRLYHRRANPDTQSVDTAFDQRDSGEIWGYPPRNI